MAKITDDTPSYADERDAVEKRVVRSVVVIGGGLAGMTAAVRLTDLGHHVTLLERKPRLGGRAYSFKERSTGQEIDNGQHVFLGCCSAYADLLAHVGSWGFVKQQDALRIEVRSNTNQIGVLSSAPLPVPFNLLPSFIKYPHLTLREKIRIVLPLLKIRFEPKIFRRGLRDLSFHNWLIRNHQSEHAITNFWDLLILPALNDQSSDVSASMGFMVFKEALLSNRRGANVGFATEGLSTAMGDTIRRWLESRGAEIRTSTSVNGFTLNADGQVDSVTLPRNQKMMADAYVMCIPPSDLEKQLPANVPNHPTFQHLGLHTYSPIVNLHIWYDRIVEDFEFMAFVGSPVQWVFNRTKIANLCGPGQYITVSLSGAWRFWSMSKADLRERFVKELQTLFPESQNAEVLRFIVVKERQATFRIPPGLQAPRPAAQTQIPNLFLAGDWTNTGWPATMESAVRSGDAAAKAVHKAFINLRDREQGDVRH